MTYVTTEQPSPALRISTPRCQPWCHKHSLDTYETHLYNGVPHVWHEAEPVETHGEDGAPILVRLDLYETADDPSSGEQRIRLLAPTSNEGGQDIVDWHLLNFEELSVAGARAVALAVLEMCDRAEGKR